MVTKALTITGATVTNGGVCSAVSPKIDQTSFRNVTVMLLITKTSGTVAGSVTILGSLDGTNYNPTTIVTAVTATDVASQVVTFQFTDKIYQYYKAVYTGTGTMVAVVSAAYITLGS